MNTKVLKTLEFNKIIDILEGFACTKIGKALCYNILPSSNINEVKRLLDETTEAVSMVLKNSTPNFGGAADLSLIIKKANINSVLSPKELLNTADTLRCSGNLKKYITELKDAEQFEILYEIFSALYTNKKLEELIFKCIDTEDHISDFASPELHKIRVRIKDEELAVKDKISALLKSGSFSKYLQENIVTIRNDRYVIPVKQEYRGEVKGLVHDSSSSGSTLFIEPMTVVESNNKIKQLRLKEKEEIERILAELSAEVTMVADELDGLNENIGKLDFAFAKAKYSIEINAFAPELNDKGYVNLKSARHPLIKKNLVVPIDIYIGDEFNTLIITGPNTGGKTVTLKTIGVLTLMALSGLHIPCKENSSVSVFDEIFADIGDEQSIEQSLSTFSSHMTNIINILKKVDSKSLVILDELGSGTDPVEGSALAMSILEELYRSGAKTVATTHYSELKTYALSTEGVRNASCEFDVKTLKPTYRLMIGLPGKSNAFAISKRLGLNTDIIERAERFISHEKTKFEDIIGELEKDKKKIQAEKEESFALLKEIERLKKELENSKVKFETEKAKILDRAREEATEILLNATETAETTIKEIKKAKKLKDEKMFKQMEKSKSKLKGALNKTFSKGSADEEEYEKFPVKVGDTVYIPSIDQKATVLGVKGDNITLQAGIMKTTMNISKLRPAQEEKVTIKDVKVSTNIGISAKNVSPELYIRKMHVEEALYELDKYMNEALMANLSTFRIVHGKGEGILKSVVHDYLKNHPNVKSYRLGQFGEGEHGVTIVELK